MIMLVRYARDNWQILQQQPPMWPVILLVSDRSHRWLLLQNLSIITCITHQHDHSKGYLKIKLALVKHLELALHGFQMGHSINFGTPFSFITKILPETRFIRVTKVMRYFMMAQLKFLTDKTSGFVQ